MSLPPTSPSRPPEAGAGALRRRAWQRLLQGNGPGTLPAWVAPHCRCVEALAVAMCDAAERQGLAVQRSVVQAGCLLHDLGRSITQDVRHAGIGADLLRRDEPAWDPRVVLAVERHTGGGIDPAEAQALGLPPRDYTPVTLEERIVCHADNLYSGSRRLTLGELRAKYEAKALGQAWSKIAALHDGLQAELGVELETLAPAALPDP